MDLGFVKDALKELKDSNFVQNFEKELSKYVEENITNDSKNVSITENNMNNLEINYKNLISKYRDEILKERFNILQNYAKSTQENGEMYYIYDNSSEKNAYNLCICDSEKSQEVIVKKTEELPQGATIGSVLRKEGENFSLDLKGTEEVGKEINDMIQEKIEDQNKYLESKRIEGHVYEVGEKNEGKISLYDLNNKAESGMEEIEEISFPTNLYEIAKEGDKFIYKDGEYQKYEQ